MKLYTAGPSPFGRKIKIALAVLGMTDVEAVTIDTADPNSDNRKQNPLGKIPTLLTDHGPLYDSRVIIEYLHDLHQNSPLIPHSNPSKSITLRNAALADGMIDAAILVVYESRMRPADKYVPEFVEYQRQKISRGLEYLEAQHLRYTQQASPDISAINLACLIDYLDFRKQLDWREYAPSLEAWITDFAAQVPGYHDTLPPDIDHAPWREA